MSTFSSALALERSEPVEEKWLRDTPPTTLAARADRIAWLTYLARRAPRGRARRLARARRRAEIRAFDRAYRAETNTPYVYWPALAIAAPAGIILGALAVALRP